MEIKKFKDLYKKFKPEDFYNWLEHDITEVRFLSKYDGSKFHNYSLLRRLAEQLNLETRYNSIYVQSFDQLKSILLFKWNNTPLTLYYNIFISVNPRRKILTKSKDGILRKTFYGGIVGTESITNILCDIEHIGERNGNATEIMLDECIKAAQYIIKIYDIDNYYINISGNGVHLWIKLETPIPIPIPEYSETEDKIKYNLKEENIFNLIKAYNYFIEKTNKLLSDYNPNIKVDEGAKDISRIARMTGSFNVKANKRKRQVGTVENSKGNNKYTTQAFLAHKVILLAENKIIAKRIKQSKNHRYTTETIRTCPLVQLLLSKLLPSTLSRNHYLEQSMARLLRQNLIDINLIQDLIQEIDLVQQKNIQVDPDYLVDNDNFNPDTINTYCIACDLPLIYKIEEDINIVWDEYISIEKFRIWKNLSKSTTDKYSEVIAGNLDGNNLTELKKLIRHLIDTTSRLNTFCTLKKNLKNWNYLNKNDIIRTLINKTRKRK